MAKKKPGTSWAKKSEIYSRMDDVGFVAHWKPSIEGIATKMVRDYRLPQSNYDDLMSDGMLALCRVPKMARWNSNYVWRAIVNRMRGGLRSAKKRFYRFELWADVPETPVGSGSGHHSQTGSAFVAFASEGIDDRLSLETLVKELRGREGFIIRMYLKGNTDREIAKRLRLTVADAKVLMTAAISTMQRAARINLLNDEPFPNPTVERQRFAAQLMEKTKPCLPTSPHHSTRNPT